VARTAPAPPRPLASALPGALGTASLPEQIHAALEDQIISGGVRPGERLLTDELAARYGVSRIPVREALRSLHEAGWVDIRPRYGVYVRARSERELTQLFESRAVIEGAIARWAAERRSDADVQALRRVVRRSRSAAARRDDALLARSGSEFSAVLRAAAANEVLAALSADLEKRARFYFSTVADHLGRDWVHTQEELVGHVAAQDGPAAARLSSRHILHTGQAVARLLRDQDGAQDRDATSA
jgi:DNA-binding GntR family transcriptional regulator